MAKSRPAGDAIALGIEVSAESIQNAVSNLQRGMSSMTRDLSRAFSSSFAAGSRSGAQTVGHLSRSFSSLSRDMSRSLTSAFNAGGRAAQSFGRIAEQALRSSERLSTGLMRSMGGGSSLGSALRMGTGIGAGMFAFDKLRQSVMSIPTAFWHAINDASEAETIERKFKSVFDNLTPQARKFAQEFAKEFGRSETEIKNTMNRFQDNLVPLGFSRDKAMGMSKMLTKLTADLAASEGISEQETADRLVSGMVGNHENFRRFGVIVTETSLNAKLLDMGLAGGLRSATELQKVMGRLNMVLAGTRDAQGMAGKAAGSFASESRALSGVWTDLSATLGKLFLPSLAKLTAFFREFASKARTALGDTDAIGKSLGGSFSKLLELAKPMQDKLVGLVEKFGKGIEWLVGKLKTFASSFKNWDGLMDGLNSAMAKIGISIYNTLRDAIRDGIKDGLSFGSNAKGLTYGGRLALNTGSLFKGLSKTLESFGILPGGLHSRIPGREDLDDFNSTTKTNGNKQRGTSGFFDSFRFLGNVFSGTAKTTEPSAAKPESDWSQMTVDDKRKMLGGMKRDDGSPMFSNWLVDSGTEDELNAAYQTKQPAIDPDYKEQQLENRKRGSTFGSELTGRMKDALRAATGIDTRSTAWSEMSEAEKRKKLFELYKRNDAGLMQDEWIEQLGTASESELNKRFSQMQEKEAEWNKTGDTFYGKIGQDLMDLAKPKENDSPFAQTMGPFDALGTMFGNIASAAASLPKMAANAFADPEKAAEEMRPRAPISFMGLQDLQKNIQLAIGEDEARKDKLKLEQGRKQLEAANKTNEQISGLPTKIADGLMKIVGLQ